MGLFSEQAEELIAKASAKVDELIVEVDKLLKENEQLRKRDRVLSALEAGGVDNWEGYSDSIREYYPEAFNEDDDEDEMV